MITNQRKFYSHVVTLSSFDERFEYLKLNGNIGIETFGCDRFINQDFYRSKIWRDFRYHIIVRDNGCDLAHSQHPINDNTIHIHHINPLTIEELMDDFQNALDEENVICVLDSTHKALHYGSKDYLQAINFADRFPNDTCPWKVQRR